MNRIFTTLFSAIQAKFMSLWTRIQLWTSKAYWEAKGITSLRQFFTKLLDVRPKNKSDYYNILRWQVSKKLAFALVIILGLASALYIFMMSPVSSAISSIGAASLRTYHYNSIPLKFYGGKARILAADGHVAYVGQVKDGAAAGQGSLYTKDGSLLYTGEFASSMYNGAGNLYYPDGTLRYQGNFADNLYNGAGKLFRNSGTTEYQGAFLNGMKSGTGTLMNSGGNQIFNGQFLADHLIYSEFLGKTTKEAAAMYTGTSGVYSSDTEYVVSLDEINAVYTALSGENSLTTDWTVGEILVMENTFPVPGKSLSTINELTAYFGQPDYFGTTWPTLSEAVAINKLADAGGKNFPKINMSLSKTFDEVYNVTSYDKNYQLYLYVYKADGLVYNFYCDSSTSSFSMYSVSADDTAASGTSGKGAGQ